MRIETPEFYVLYNGKKKYPEKDKVNLSDLFKVQDGRSINLELIVDVYNVNHGHNEEIMKRSKTLDEYAAFVDKVESYKYNKGLTQTEALNKAVEDCIRANILSEFLQKHGGEIVSILNIDWTIDDEKRIAAAEAKEEKAEDIAEEMLLDGEPISKIVKYTKLTEEKISDLKKKLKI
jgi:hypothetical protein